MGIFVCSERRTKSEFFFVKIRTLNFEKLLDRLSASGRRRAGKKEEGFGGNSASPEQKTEASPASWRGGQFRQFRFRFLHL